MERISYLVDSDSEHSRGTLKQKTGKKQDIPISRRLVIALRNYDLNELREILPKCESIHIADLIRYLNFYKLPILRKKLIWDLVLQKCGHVKLEFILSSFDEDLFLLVESSLLNYDLTAHPLLLRSIDYHKPRFVLLALQHGANPNEPLGLKNPLVMAFMNNNPLITHILLDHGADPLQVRESVWSAGFSQSQELGRRRPSAEIVRALMEHGWWCLPLREDYSIVFDEFKKDVRKKVEPTSDIPSDCWDVIFTFV